MISPAALDEFYLNASLLLRPTKKQKKFCSCGQEKSQVPDLRILCKMLGFWLGACPRFSERFRGKGFGGIFFLLKVLEIFCSFQKKSLARKSSGLSQSKNLVLLFCGLSVFSGNMNRCTTENRLSTSRRNSSRMRLYALKTSSVMGNYM